MKKILIIALIYVCLSRVSAQSILPMVVSDTFFFPEKVYVQTLEQEATQQAEIFGYKRKIKKLQKIIHKKKRIEPIIDSLVYEIDTLQSTIDSLNLVIHSAGRDNISNCQAELIMYVEQINQLRFRLKYLQILKRRLRKIIVISSSIAVIELIIIL